MMADHWEPRPRMGGRGTGPAEMVVTTPPSAQGWGGRGRPYTARTHGSSSRGGVDMQQHSCPAGEGQTVGRPCSHTHPRGRTPRCVGTGLGFLCSGGLPRQVQPCSCFRTSRLDSPWVSSSPGPMLGVTVPHLDPPWCHRPSPASSLSLWSSLYRPPETERCRNSCVTSGLPAPPLAVGSDGLSRHCGPRRRQRLLSRSVSPPASCPLLPTPGPVPALLGTEPLFLHVESPPLQRQYERRQKSAGVGEDVGGESALSLGWGEASSTGHTAGDVRWTPEAQGASSQEPEGRVGLGDHGDLAGTGSWEERPG